jgi:multiple sugar transport system permease protein
VRDNPVSRTNRFLKQRFNLTLYTVPVWIGGLLIAAIWVAPFVWMVSTSLKPSNEIMTRDIEWIPCHITIQNYEMVFRHHPVLRWILNSVIVTFGATSMSVLLGAMAGYGLARLHFPGRELIFNVMLASIMIPQQIALIPLFVAFLKIGFVNSYPALIAPGIASVLCVYIFRQFFISLPKELEDAALIDGAGRFGVFWRVALPLARSPITASAILVFTANWNDFLWPLLVALTENMKTLAVGAAQFAPVIGGHTQLESFGPGMAAVTLLSIPTVALFLILQNYFIEGITQGALKG